MEVHGVVPGELIENDAALRGVLGFLSAAIKESGSDSLVDSNVDDFGVVLESFGDFLSDDLFEDPYFFVDLFLELIFGQSFPVDDQDRRHDVLFDSVYNLDGFVVVSPQPVIEDQLKLRVRNVVFSPQAIPAVGVYLSLLLVGRAHKRHREFPVQGRC